MTRLTLNWFKLCITEVISTFIPLPPPLNNSHTTTTGIRITIIFRYYHINAGATCNGLGGRVMVKSYLL